MKKVIAIGMLIFSGAAMAASANGASPLTDLNLPLMLLAHAGHHHAQAESESPQTAVYSANVSKTVSVSDCWIRSLPEPAPSAGYFVIKNSGDKAVKVTGASAAAFGMVMLHQTTNEGGMSKMSMVEDVSIPAGGELAFKPGSYHAMLEKPKAALKVGAVTAIDFMFDSGEKAIALCEVKPANTMSH